MSTANGAFEIVSGKDDAGNFIFSVLVKRTYRIVPGRALERCATDSALRRTDVYYDDGDPEWSTVLHESDLSPFKPRVDVVVIGEAHAPRAQPVQRMNVSVRVGEHEKSLAVSGDRACHFRANQPPVVSDPQPFITMPIRYERAYGGKDTVSDPEIPFHYPRNDMGCGVALCNVAAAVQGLVMPNIEAHDDLLTPERIVIGEPDRWHLQPLPQGFGWLQRSWYPRATHAGAYPAFLDIGTVTAEERLGMVPPNHIALARQFRLPSFHPRFDNGAAFGMTFPDLAADEWIELEGLCPEGICRFSLPGETPRIALDTGRGGEALVARLHTVNVRVEDERVDLVWRGALRYEGYAWLAQMTRLHAEVC